jgi:hypothetical protein
VGALEQELGRRCYLVRVRGLELQTRVQGASARIAQGRGAGGRGRARAANRLRAWRAACRERAACRRERHLDDALADALLARERGVIIGVTSQAVDLGETRKVAA